MIWEILYTILWTYGAIVAVGLAIWFVVLVLVWLRDSVSGSGKERYERELFDEVMRQHRARLDQKK
jgi:hypothetical protein